MNRFSDFFTVRDNFQIFKHVESILKYGVRGSNPLISIMIPTYKRPELLNEAIKSVVNQKNYDNFEIVVVDNDDTMCYTEEIIKIIQAYDDRRISYYLNSANIGVFGNWNRCIELANGEFMTILSDDDFLLPDFLVKMASFIEKNQDIARVECKYLTYYQLNKSTPILKLKRLIKQYILGASYNLQKGWHHYLSKSIYDIFGITAKKITAPMYLTGCFTAAHSQLYRVDYAKRLGGFNPNYAPISDYVFNVFYVYRFGNCYQINEYLSVYRVLVNESLSRKVEFNCVKGDKYLTQCIVNKDYRLRTVILRFFYLKCRYLSYKRVWYVSIYSNLFRLVKLFCDLPFK